jgi:hypothetical protein
MTASRTDLVLFVCIALLMAGFVIGAASLVLWAATAGV